MKCGPGQKDIILRNAFEQLKARGVGSRWAASQNPWTELEIECRVLMDDLDFVKVLDSYLRAHTSLQRSET
jgi:hypothetical protein